MIKRFKNWVLRSESRCAWVYRHSRWFSREFVMRCWKRGIGHYEQRVFGPREASK
jgi:hypothetical protein